MMNDESLPSAAAWACSYTSNNIFDAVDAAFIARPRRWRWWAVAGDRGRADLTQDRAITALSGHYSWLHFECFEQIDS